VIALPPLEEGAVQLTVACAFPAVAVTLVGAPGVIEAMGNRLIPGLDLDAAGAIVAALSAAEVYLELVVGGGWSPDRDTSPGSPT
jgi:hypothetical protein